MAKVIAFCESVATWVKQSPYYVAGLFIIAMTIGSML